jgi:hypothetical protein
MYFTKWSAQPRGRLWQNASKLLMLIVMPDLIRHPDAYAGQAELDSGSSPE